MPARNDGAMKSIPDTVAIDTALDEMPEEAFSAGDPIGVTFAGGIHESDLLSFLERAKRLAGEVC
jgi:hypothetical protein